MKKFRRHSGIGQKPNGIGHKPKGVRHRAEGGPRPEGLEPRVGSRAESRSRIPDGRVVVGIHAVEELLAVRPKAIIQFWIREKFNDHPQLTALHDHAKSLGVRVQTQTPGTLDKVVGSHQGVIAFAGEDPEINWPEIESSKQATLIALDEVEDPHNLGAVLRTAWLLGAQGVLTPERRSAQLSPAVSKVAQGAVEHVPVVSDMSLPQQLEALKQHGFWILGLSHKAKQGLYTFEVPEKVIWVLGSESSGLRKSVEGMCDDLISIPQLAPNASYNVSVAAAMALGETYRQRHTT
jgi:23S rRNA (guanosine2251-2'-O)-methyltransferase